MKKNIAHLRRYASKCSFDFTERIVQWTRSSISSHLHVAEAGG